MAICFVAAALRPIGARGIDPKAILEPGVSAELLRSPNARVSAQQYGALWRLIALTLDDELVGQDSRAMKAGTFAMICPAVLNASCLRQAIDRALRFLRLVLEDIEVLCGWGRLSPACGWSKAPVRLVYSARSAC